MKKIGRSDRLLTQNQTTFFVQPIAAVNGRGQSFDSTTFGFWSKTVNQSQSDLRPDASRPTLFDLTNSAVTIWPQEAPTVSWNYNQKIVFICVARAEYIWKETFDKMSYQVASGSRPQPVEMSAQQAYDQFWPRQQEDMRCLEAGAFKQQELPLARYIQ